MRILRILFLLLVSVAAFGQSESFKVSTSIDELLGKGVTVAFSFSLPADNPFQKNAQLFPDSAPAKAVWLWGDEQQGAKTRSYSEYSWQAGQRVTHLYKQPGQYAVMVVVVDSKGRLVQQSTVKVKIQSPVVIE